MRKAFDPNKSQNVCRAIPKGEESWISRVDALKTELRKEIAKIIPPAYRDRIVWYTYRYHGKNIDGFVIWRYPGR